MGSHILIVDDNAGIRETMKEFLSIDKHYVSAVANAEETLEFLKTAKIDVIITDIKMDGIDGLELTDIIRKSYDTGVIVMTGFTGDYSYEEAVSKGASDFVFKPVRFEELRLRLNRVLRERKLEKERIEMLRELKKLAITDGLTKLYNSRYFYNQLEMEVDRLIRYNHPLSLLLLDIDDFKVFNDSYGHLKGDKVLIKLGKIIISCLRKMDTAYRYGGEEFTVILPETSNKEAIVVAERIRSAVEYEKFLPEPGKTASISISVGVTEYANNESISSLIQRADKAMYLSKDKGRNCISTLFVDETAGDTSPS